MRAVTVLSGPERRRRWSSAEKRRIVAESRAPGVSVAAVARRRDLHPNLLHLWRRLARKGVLVSGQGVDVHFTAVAMAAAERAAEAATVDDGASCVIEVVLGNGRMLRLPSDATPAEVARLAEALEGHGR